MKKTMLMIVSLFFFTGISLGALKAKTMPENDKTSPGNDPSRALTLCQRLACLADKLEMSAKASFWKKEYQDAIDCYHLLIKAGKSEFDDLYNLACCYAQMGNDNKAAKYLKLAVEEGFTDIEHIKADQDFEKVKNTQNFKKALLEISVKLGQADNPQAQKDEKAAQSATDQGLVLVLEAKN